MNDQRYVGYLTFSARSPEAFKCVTRVFARERQGAIAGAVLDLGLLDAAAVALNIKIFKDFDQQAIGFGEVQPGDCSFQQLEARLER